MITCHCKRRMYLGCTNIKDWPIWITRRGYLRRSSCLKHVSRARYHQDSIWELPRDLTKLAIAYGREPKMIYIPSNGNCPMCDPEYGPEWPCDWHDEPQPNSDYRRIRVRDLRIHMICV